jgi:hypothetical protein
MHDVAAYALDALEELDRKRFERHLSGCARCRDELPGLHEAAAALAFAVPSAEPPPLRRPTRRRLPLVPLAAIAAAAAAVVLAVHLQTDEARTVALAGAAGRLVVARDRSARLDVNLPRLAAGRVYEAWVVHDGRRLPAGTFDGRAVDLSRRVLHGDRVAVTVEPTGRVVLRSERA